MLSFFKRLRICSASVCSSPSGGGVGVGASAGAGASAVLVNLAISAFCFSYSGVVTSGSSEEISPSYLSRYKRMFERWI